MHLQPKRALAWTSGLGALCLGAMALETAPQDSHAPTEVATESESPVVRSRASAVHLMIPDLPFETLVQAATNVVYGKILRSQPIFLDGSMPYTEYELEVFAAFKEQAGARLIFGVGGAVSEDHVLHVDRAPQFQVGEIVVILTCQSSGNLPPGILGLDLGTYRVAKEPAGHSVVTHERTRQVESLDQLIENIQVAVGYQSNNQEGGR